MGSHSVYVAARKTEERRTAKLRKSSVLSVCLLVGLWGFEVLYVHPSVGFGLCEAPEAYFGGCPYCLWVEQQFCTRYLFEVEFGAFFQSKNRLPFLADCQGC